MRLLRQFVHAVAAMAALPLVAAAALVATAPAAQAVETASPVVISEVYGGGGNSGAQYKNDFIELYNSGTTAVDLSTWSVQYASSGGSTWQRTNLVGSVPPATFYLVQEAAGTNTAAPPLPTPDATGTLALSGTAGKVALVSSQTTLSGCATTCSSAAGVVDFVGYGGANDSAGGAPTPASSNTTSAQRSPTPSTNTGVNGSDFTVADPTPKAPLVTAEPPPNPCAATPLPPECVAGTTTIQDIQGSGFVSPLKGTTVEKVAGVVTAVRTSTSPGFWMQQIIRDDSRPAASSGLFVYTATAPTVKTGDAVLVTGTVTDYYPLADGETVNTTANLSTTEISPATTITLFSSGNALPAALTITPTSVPSRYAPTPADGNVESISPVDPAHSALEFWEAHEGMLVTVDDARVVGPGDTQFREIYVTSKPEELKTPRGGTYLKSYAETPTGRLLVTPISGNVPSANVGDVLAGATTGPVDWSSFGGYDIVATTLGTYTNHGLTATSAAAQAIDQLAVGTYNVENLAPGDAATKYARLGAGVVDNLRAPDVIAVEEIQDNSGALDDGVVAADLTLTKLTAAIRAAGGPAYQWAEIDPVNKQDGGQPGGNIRSVLLYNTARVTLAPGTPGGSLDPLAVSTAPDGTAALSLNPGRVDPTNSAWTSSRKPLAGAFVFEGRKVIVIANHLNSKGGDQTADGRFQPPNRSSEVQRLQQATVLNAFVHSVLAADPNANVVLAGDFNDYQFSAPILRLTDNGATLTDLITTLPENQRYTYVFNGVSQVLDHIFVTKPVTDVEYDVVHLNAEFANQVSDHDPQVVRIRPTVRQGTLTLDPAATTTGATVNVSLAGWYPNREFTLALDGTTLGTVTTDAAGAAVYAFTVIPGTSFGAHTVTATSTADRAHASATLNVRVTLGTVVLSPPKIKAGKQLKVEVFQWSPNVSLSVLLDGSTPLGTLTTDATGYATGKVVIPAGTSVGSHRVVVRASDGGEVSSPLAVSR